MSSQNPRTEMLGALKHVDIYQEGLCLLSLDPPSPLREPLGPVLCPAASSAVSDLCKIQLGPSRPSDSTDFLQETAV